MILRLPRQLIFHLGCLAAFSLAAEEPDVTFRAFGARDACAPETWFHVIDGNASKEGVRADLDAIASAGIGGIQFFHGGWGGKLWPGVTNSIACLSPQWTDFVRFVERECHARGLSFKMQNCPGWSMSGGPWIAPTNAMRKLVAFEPGKCPSFDADDDYHEIGEVTFPLEDSSDIAVTFPNPQQINHHWAYDPGADLVFLNGSNEVFRTKCPPGAWQDVVGMTFRVSGVETAELKASYAVESVHYPRKELKGHWSAEPRLDMWEAKSGWGLRGFTMSTNATPVRTRGSRTLVFGHVNAKRRNGPAPKEGTGWECDKMDPRGFEANWNGYLGRLMREGVKIDGLLVDSWECGVQTWTWKMEEAFRRQNGYELRPWLPALFGYVLKSEAETEKFLLDWRRTCSRLVEENYYGVLSRLARENGLSTQFETAFGDVIVGDILRYWKYADEPMCEFWSPFDNERGFVGSHNFKPVRPCVSAAHLYGKRRVSAEAFTSNQLTFDESMQELKENANRHFARGVTHLVFHTYTHNPVVGGKAPGSSFGTGLGTPFLRLQPWWPYMKEFTAYLAECCRELERGLPVVDILWYLGDALAHKPDESADLFGNRYKYDYINQDALLTRLSVADGRFVLPDGMSYRVLWIPDGTFLLPESEGKIAELERAGGRVVRGDLEPDWPSPLEMIGETPRYWYQRQDGGTNVFFVAETNGVSRFVHVVDGRRTEGDVVSPARPIVWRTLANELCQSFDYRSADGRVWIDLGDVRYWATVKVNGQVAGRLWCRPYRCELTSFLKEGENRLEIEPTTTIYNQLVKDAAKPEAERQTWTIAGPKASAPLRPEGILGPIRLVRDLGRDGGRARCEGAGLIRKMRRYE